MPLQRISHSKSRYGCIQCKGRRLKCDETRPECQRCQRTGQTCSYRQQEPYRDANHPNDDISNVADMILLHHFFTNSRDFKVDDTEVEDTTAMKNDDPVSLAFSHHYLLHAILALSALHLYSKDVQQQTWYERAISHHDAAIRQARPHLLQISNHHAVALFWFSVFTSLFAFAEPLLRPNISSAKNAISVDYIDELMKAFRMSRGVSTIMARQDGSSAINQQTAASRFNANHEDSSLPIHQAYPQLMVLKDLIRESEGHGLNAETTHECLVAVEELFLRIAALQRDPSNKKLTYLIMTWGIDRDDGFLELCKSKNTAATSILAVYAIALHTRQWFWPFRGWPKVLLTACEQALKPSNPACASILGFARETICSDIGEIATE